MNKNLAKRLGELEGFAAGGHISAYDDAGEARKEAFHNCGRYVLKQAAKELGLATGTFQVRSNKAGIAVAGDVILDAPGVYVMMGDSLNHLGIMYRYHEEGRRDGANNWFKGDRIAGQWEQFIDALRKCIQSKAPPF